MKTSRILICAAVLAAAISCKKEADYTPAPAASGTQYFFATGTPGSYTITPETTGFDFTVKRVAKEAASSVVIEVADTSKTVYSEGKGTLTASFAAGEDATTVTLPINYANYEYNDLFGLDMTIAEETSPYGISSIHFEITLPEPWVSLGIGYLTDGFTFSSKYMETLYKGKWAEVEIFKNEANPAQFKLVAPYDGYLDFNEGDADPNVGRIDEVILTIMKKGDTPNPNGEAVAEDGCVYWPQFATEIYDDGQDIYPLHPAMFNSLATAANYSLSKVTSYQENGLPAVIELNPYWYVLTTELGTVGGWGFAATITIAFPGIPVTDFSTSIEFDGLLTNKDGSTEAIANVKLGSDVTEALISIAPGEDPDAAFDLILAGDESLISVTKSGEVKIPVPEEVGEYYSIVIAPVVDGEVLAEEASYDTFAFKDYSISVVASEPVLNDDEVSSTVEASFVFGEDVEYAKVAIFAKTAKEIAAEDLAIFDEEDNENVILVKHSDDIVPFILTEEGNYTIVALSYGLEKSWNAAVAEFEYTLVDPWNYLGKGTLTDGFFFPLFGKADATVACDIYEHSENPGLYKVGGYQLALTAAFFGVSEDVMTAYEGENWKSTELKVDATDPNAVVIGQQEYGLLVNDDYGWVLIQTEASGTLADGVITWPAKEMYVGLGSWYYANTNGTFKITLPTEAPSGAPALAPKKVNKNVVPMQCNNTPSLDKVKTTASRNAVSIASGRIFGKTMNIKSTL